MTEEIVPKCHKKKFQDMTLQELKEERAYWEQKIKSYKEWGAAVSASHEFKMECDRWIKVYEQRQ